MSHVVAWLEAQQPDVLALQEIKMSDSEFPALEFDRLGYQAICSGQPSYNGVALLTKKDADDVVTALPDFDDPQKRVLGAKVDGVYVVDLYVPNGQAVASDKYRYKLEWMAQLAHWLESLIKEQPKLVLLGDFNVAPDDRDVFDPKAWHDEVLVSEPERKAPPRAPGLSGACRTASACCTTAAVTSVGGITGPPVSSATRGCASTTSSCPHPWRNAAAPPG